MEAATNAPKSTSGGNASEPVSGATGDVSKGEPYDAGNMEPTDQERVKRSMEEGHRPETTNNNSSSHTGDNDKNTGGGGNANASDKSSGGNGGGGAAASSGSKSDNNNNNDNNSGDDNEEKQGTGELHVKSSGFAADGGDFDATKPGAGREADRLMEKKDPSAAHSANTGATQAPQNPPAGGGGGGGGTGENNNGGGDSGNKEGMMDKLKHKLHKH